MPALVNRNLVPLFTLEEAMQEQTWIIWSAGARQDGKGTKFGLALETCSQVTSPGGGDSINDYFSPGWAQLRFHVLLGEASELQNSLCIPGLTQMDFPPP